MKLHFDREVLYKTSIMLGMVLCFAFQKLPLIVGMTALLWVVIYFKYENVGLTKLQAKVSIALVVLLMPVFFKPYFGFSPVFYLFSFFGTLGTSIWLARDIESLFRAFRMLYFIAASLIGVVLVIFGNTANPFEQIIPGVSQNGIPAYLILLQVGYSVMSYLARRRLPEFSPLFTLLVAFYGEGRGSLVVAFSILVSTLVFTVFIRSKGNWSKLWKLSIVTVSIYFVIRHGQELLLYVTLHSKLSVGLVDLNRLDILNAYLSKMNFWTIFVGADYSGTIIESKHDGNPHISMIRSHALFGLFVPVMLFTSPFVVMWAPLPILSRAIVFSFLVLGIARSATEPLLFPTLLDGLYLSLILACFSRSAPPKSRSLSGCSECTSTVRKIGACND